MLRANFYHDCYLKTGWIPMQPLSRKIAVGDVCQIQHGNVLPLLNLEQANVVESISISNALHLNPIEWAIQRGVMQTHCAIRTDANKAGEPYQWTEQVLEFDAPGSFLFHGQEPRAHLLLNWHHIKDDVTLKLTQLHYSFRDVYVITGVASMPDWGLAIAGQAGAQLEMSATVGNTDYYALLSHQSAQTVKCRGINCYEQSKGMPAHFFKAKKLVISDESYDHYLRKVIADEEELGLRATANWLASNLLNLVKSNELNLNTCIKFFSWVDCSLDDVARLVETNQ